MCCADRSAAEGVGPTEGVRRQHGEIAFSFVATACIWVTAAAVPIMPCRATWLLCGCDSRVKSQSMTLFKTQLQVQEQRHAA